MEPNEKLFRIGSIFPVIRVLLTVSLYSTTCLAQALAQAGGKAPVMEQTRPSTGAVPVKSVGSELDMLSDSAEAIFDLAESGKIDRLRKKLEALKKNASALAGIRSLSAGSRSQLQRLEHALTDLEHAVTAGDRVGVMKCSSKIMLIASTMTIPNQPGVPAEVSLLDYNDRELGICSEMKKTDKLPGVVMRMHLVWQNLMPKLVEHNGTRELKRFSAIMERLESAKTPEEYGRLARQAAPAIDDLRDIFAKSVKQPNSSR